MRIVKMSLLTLTPPDLFEDPMAKAIWDLLEKYGLDSLSAAFSPIDGSPYVRVNFKGSVNIAPPIHSFEEHLKDLEEILAEGTAFSQLCESALTEGVSENEIEKWIREREED